MPFYLHYGTIYILNVFDAKLNTGTGNDNRYRLFAFKCLESNQAHISAVVKCVAIVFFFLCMCVAEY
jgi:hypothetical protein